MRVPCACKRYLIEANDATYVRDGKPLCHTHTCEMVKRYRREIIDLARAPYFDEDPPPLKHTYPDI